MQAFGTHELYGGGPSRNFRLPYAHSDRDGLNDGYDDQLGRPAGAECQIGDDTEASQLWDEGTVLDLSSSSG